MLSTATALATGALASEANNPIVPEIGELVVGALAFGILFAVLAVKAFPRIQAVYEERTDRIEGGLKRAEAAQAEAQRTLEQYKAQLAEARQEAARIREEARDEGRAIVAQLREEAHAEAARISAQNDEKMRADREQATASLRREVGGIALSLAERVLGETLSDDERQRRLVDRFLADLEQSPTGSDGATASAAPTATAQV